MNDIKDYRNNELKNYVIGNILLVLYFSGIFDNLFTLDINSNLNIWKTLIGDYEKKSVNNNLL